MKFTRSQKICLLVLGLAVSAFILDRCFGESGAAPAQTPVEHTLAPISTGTSISPSSPEVIPSSSKADLADRLALLDSTPHSNDISRDAFSITSALTIDAAGSGEDSERIIRFQASHHLKSVIFNQKSGQAVVDTSLIRVGQCFDGFILESVGPTQAVFTSGTARTELQLE